MIQRWAVQVSFLIKYEAVEQALTHQKRNLLSIIDASGAVLVYEDHIVTLGATPDEEQLKKMFKWLAFKRTKFKLEIKTQVKVNL
ncbi:GAF domain-containing protein [Arcticibacter svalbardensis]|uniref:hypothetical protein n=1 Tax=Arcticibacter svalbardensis TaxID=1288027 RepID=UPI001360B0B5|nr:hypothetical protein [Arcticibacter svalbardensis]